MELCGTSALYLGIGIRVDTKIFGEGVDYPSTVPIGTPFETWRFSLPITVGYRSPIKKNVGFIGELVVLLGTTVYNGYSGEFTTFTPITTTYSTYEELPFYSLNL